MTGDVRFNPAKTNPSGARRRGRGSARQHPVEWKEQFGENKPIRRAPHRARQRQATSRGVEGAIRRNKPIRRAPRRACKRDGTSGPATPCREAFKGPGFEHNQAKRSQRQATENRIGLREMRFCSAGQARAGAERTQRDARIGAWPAAFLQAAAPFRRKPVSAACRAGGVVLDSLPVIRKDLDSCRRRSMALFVWR